MAKLKDKLGKASAADRKKLLAAIEEGDAEGAKRLLERCDLANAVGKNRVSVLQSAIMASSWQPSMASVVNVLIDMGAEIDHRDKNGETPLLWAARFGRKKVANKLIGLGASVHTIDTVRGWNVLLNAAIHGHDGIVATLVKHGADPLAVGPGVSPLVVAAEGGASKLMEQLVELGSDVNVRDADGETPLSVATRGEHRKAVALLLQHGAEPSLALEGGQTALHIAAAEMQHGMAKLLIKNGADVLAKDDSGCIPLDLVPDADEDDEEEVADARKLRRLLTRSK